jgi:hypothetical protein
MKNIKAIQAFLTTKLSGELTIIATSNALKQWQHGDIAPAIDTLQALTGKPYTIIKTDTLEAKKATLITALKTASGADNVKARLHALGETLESVNGTNDYLDLAGNVPELIKTHLAECKAERALRKAEKQSEVITITPDTVKAANDNLPAFHAEAPTINPIADIINSLGKYSATDRTTLFEALAASLGYDLKMVETETA